MTPEILTLQCSSCEEDLIQVIITKPNDNIINHVKAMCPYCNDQSFTKQFKGGIAIQGTQKTQMLDVNTFDENVSENTLYRRTTVLTKKIEV